MIRLWFASLLFAAVAGILWAHNSNGQNILTPRDTFLNMLAHASEEPGHALWFYIAGLVSGANAMSLIQTGEAVICDAHEFEETRKTEDLIMNWLIRTDQISNPEILLEVVVPLAFAEEYPCTTI